MSAEVTPEVVAALVRCLTDEEVAELRMAVLEEQSDPRNAAVRDTLVRLLAGAAEALPLALRASA